jgi:hypothetical protein
VLRFWSEEKDKFYHAFGEKLIISKEICVAEDASMRELAMEGIWDHPTYKALSNAFYNYFTPHVRNYWRTSSHTEEEENMYKAENAQSALMGINHLASNSWEWDKVEIKLNGKSIVINKGMSVIKALGKLARALGFDEEFEAFRNYHSTFFQTKKVTGTMHLSIHPLDYMTMSDNTHGWSSCMNWREGGCYRQGTVEMMNSPYVIVAYLTTDREMGLPNGASWNSKAWRTLLIAHPDHLTSVKSYPYQSSAFTEAALQFLSETLGGYEMSVNKWEARWDCVHRGYCVPKDGQTYRYIDFNTEGHCMYNDFGSAPHYTIWRYDLEADTDSNAEEICYSGKTECVICGDTFYPEDEDSCDLVACEDCCGIDRCSVCGCRIRDCDGHWMNDELLCDYCYNDCTYYDAILGCREYTENAEKVYLYDKDHLVMWVYMNRDEISDQEWTKYFGSAEIQTRSDGWCYRPWFDIKHLTRSGLDVVLDSDSCVHDWDYVENLRLKLRNGL